MDQSVPARRPAPPTHDPSHPGICMSENTRSGIKGEVTCPIIQDHFAVALLLHERCTDNDFPFFIFLSENDFV